jgi:CheY-like chemotaxis protein
LLNLAAAMKQLLIVAKDPTLCDAVATALRDVPCVLTSADSAESALAVLLDHRIDLIFLDLQGLGKDALRVLQAVRSDGNPVPVFVAPTRRAEDMASLRAAASRGIYYETMRIPVAHAEIRAATTAAFSLS